MGVSTQYNLKVPNNVFDNSIIETDNPKNVKRPFTHVLDSQLAQIEQINEIIDYESSIGFDQALQMVEELQNSGLSSEDYIEKLKQRIIMANASAPPMEIRSKMPEPSAPPMEIRSEMPEPSAPPMDLKLQETLQAYRNRRQQEEKERLLRVEAYQKKQKENETLAAQKTKLTLDQQPTQKNKALGEFVLAARKERQRLNQPPRPSIRQALLRYFQQKKSSKNENNALLNKLYKEREARKKTIENQIKVDQKTNLQAKATASIQETYDYYSHQNNVRQANILGMTVEEYLAKK